MLDDLDHLVTCAVTSVFATMLDFPVVREPLGTLISAGEPHIAGSVGFTGTVTGVVFVYSSTRFANRMTQGLLGLKKHEPSGDEMVNDAMGEITNMVVGSLKSRFADRGMTCDLTIPSILRGGHFTIEPTSTSRRRICTFQCDGSQVVVEVLLKSAPAEAAFAV